MFCFVIFIGENKGLADVRFSSKRTFSALDAALAYARDNSFRLHGISSIITKMSSWGN